MKNWWNESVPSFAVVGRVNSGKTSTLATLLEIDDEEVLRISSTPGETTAIQPLPVVYDDEEWIRFFDSPGFQQSVAALRVIEEMAGDRKPGPDEIRCFVEKCGDRFPDEVRLLEPAVRGAGILYVVDPAKPVRDSFLAEIEILRWTGAPRLALLNPQGDENQYLREWRERLGTAFNLVRTFDAHRARYDERCRLLEALLQIEESHVDRITHVIEAMESEWSQRREESVEVLMDFLEASLVLRTSDGLDERDLGMHSRRERKQSALVAEYHHKLARLESKCVGKLLEIYRHHLIEREADPTQHRGLDLETAETWKHWGLNRLQLTAAGATAGGIAGAAVDLGFGVHTLGAGTVIGALGGGSAAFLKGGQLPELKVTLGGGVKLKSSEGKTLVVGPPKNPNFPWVLLDSMLVRYHSILSRAHGQRDSRSLPSEASASRVRQFSSDRRNVLQKWFQSCMKGKPDRAKESEIYEALLGVLEEVEAGQL